MTEIERKALALVNEVTGHNWEPRESAGLPYFKVLCRAIEQHEAFKREVSDAVDAYLAHMSPWPDNSLRRFILPKPVDPLVEAIDDLKDGRAGGTTESYAACLRAALAKRGLEIREVEG